MEVHVRQHSGSLTHTYIFVCSCVCVGCSHKSAFVGVQVHRESWQICKQEWCAYTYFSFAWCLCTGTTRSFLVHFHIFIAGFQRRRRPLVKHDCRMMSACPNLRPLLPKTQRVDETDELSGWEHFTPLKQWRRLITARLRQTGDSFLYLLLTSTLKELVLLWKNVCTAACFLQHALSFWVYFGLYFLHVPSFSASRDGIAKNPPSTRSLLLLKKQPSTTTGYQLGFHTDSRFKVIE